MMLHATGVMMPQKRIKMKTMMMIIIVMMMVAMVDDDAAGDAGGGGLVVIGTSAEVNRIEGSATAALRTGFVHKYPTYSLHCSSFLGLPYRILIIYLVKPKKGTTMETIGRVSEGSKAQLL